MVGSKIRPPSLFRNSKPPLKNNIIGEKLTNINKTVIINPNNNERTDTLPKVSRFLLNSEKISSLVPPSSKASEAKDARIENGVNRTALRSAIPKVLMRSDTFTCSTEQINTTNTPATYRTFVQKPIESGTTLHSAMNETKDIKKSSDNKMKPANVTYTKPVNIICHEEVSTSDYDITLTMQNQLPLNSTMNTEYLLDISQQTGSNKHMQSLNLTNDFLSPSKNAVNNTKLLYMTRASLSASNTPIGNSTQLFNWNREDLDETLVERHAQCDSNFSNTANEQHSAVRDRKGHMSGQLTRKNLAISLQDISQQQNATTVGNFPFGLDLTANTLNCSIELADISLSSTVLSQPITHNLTRANSAQNLQNLLTKGNSFETEESFGILTPDQMKDFLGSSALSNNKMFNSRINLASPQSNTSHNQNKLISLHQLRLEQTPSPEELPLDTISTEESPIKLKVNEEETIMTALSLENATQKLPSLISSSSDKFSSDSHESGSQTYNDSGKITIESIAKSSGSKISTSFITSVTSVTSVTSLDNGYQGDGEMSRPASRGAYDISPSNGPGRRGVSRQPSFHQHSFSHTPTAIRSRPDPMTDSDFFTESDADDVLRGDRRVQVIDGQLYGPMRESSTSVYIAEDPQVQDSCMDSSGIFTDIENRENVEEEKLRTSQPSKAEHLKATELVKCPALKDNMEFTGDLSVSTTTRDRSNNNSNTVFSHCSVSDDHSNYSNGKYKSFLSLDEAFAGETIAEQNKFEAKQVTAHYSQQYDHGELSKSSVTSWQETFDQNQRGAVQRETSKCKHVSLLSLCGAENGMRDNITVAPFQQLGRVPDVLEKCMPDDKRDALFENSDIRDNTRSKVSTPSSEKTSRASQEAINRPTIVESPVSRNGASNTSLITRESSSPAVVLGRKISHTPNKWDAVMSQIANNRKVLKTNFSDVKSKVYTRFNTHGSVNKLSSREYNNDNARLSPLSDRRKASPQSPRVHDSVKTTTLSKGLSNGSLINNR